MPLTPIEWIVTIFAVLGLIKIIVILVNKEGWWPVVKGAWSRPGLTGAVSLILAAIVLWYLLQELTIVQILAAMAFTALLMVFAFIQYSDELLALAKKILKKKFSGWLWLYIVIWVVLLLWALYEIFLV
jgi:hypothetical protein